MMSCEPFCHEMIEVNTNHRMTNLNSILNLKMMSFEHCNLKSLLLGMVLYLSCHLCQGS
jgi:hypothetical protein